MIFKFKDICNSGELALLPSSPLSNSLNVHPFVLHDNGFVITVVLADCLQDALDIAVDAGKIAQFKIGVNEMGDYDMESFEGVSILGNYGDPYDIRGMEVVE